MSGARVRERRAARRWLPQELPWPIACRITPGHDVLILDLSAVGILVEVEAALPPGHQVVVHLTRPSRRVSLDGRVVRSFVSAVDRLQGPSFRAGIAFSRWFDALCELDSYEWEGDVGIRGQPGTTA